jgi:hypothetical protein
MEGVAKNVQVEHTVTIGEFTKWPECMTNTQGNSQPKLIVGIPEEWENFRQRHDRFLERLQNLEAALNTVFARVIEISSPLDRIIYFSGRLCVS